MCGVSTLVMVAVLAGGAIVYYLWKRRRESFKVLGNMGPQRELYYKCTSDCERSDPGKQLSPTHGNMMCLEYCDSVITDIARRGGPSDPDELPVAPTKIVTSIDDAYHVCGDGDANAWCREKYFTATEIDAKCRQDCEYSTYPSGQCMRLCAASKAGNYSLGWSWK